MVERAAKRIESSVQKVRILATLADTWWPYDQDHAQTIFSSAFYEIDLVKLDPQKDQRVRMAINAGGVDPLSSLRSEVLQLVAARNSALAKKLLTSFQERLREAGKTNDEEVEELRWDVAIASANTHPEQTVGFFRSQMRRELNDTLISALAAMRRINPSLSDQLFIEAVALAETRLSDAGDFVSLALYVLPSEGMPSFAPGEPIDPKLSGVIKAFVEYISKRLVAQMNIGPSSITRGNEAVDEYRTLEAIVTLVDRFAPERTVLVRQRMSTVREHMSSRNADTVSPRDQDVQELLHQAETIVGSAKRDFRLIQVSGIAARQGDLELAISIAEKISDLEEREIQTSLLFYQRSLNAVEKGDLDSAYRYAKKVEFLPQRVMAFRRLADQAKASRNKQRSLALIEEIWEWLSAKPNSAQKDRELITLTVEMAGYDRDCAFVFLSDTVKSINGTDFSAPEPARRTRVMQVTLDMLEIDNVFGVAAREDLERALAEAQALKNPEASLLAQLMVYKELLNPGR